MDSFIYIICLGVGLLFTLVSAFFGHAFGGGHEGHLEGSGGHAETGDTNGMPGVSPFSPTIIACFITAFGGLGIIFKRIPATSSAWLSAPLAVLGAILISFLILGILRQLFRSTQCSSEARVGDLLGTVADVITPIPEHGVGEIAYVQAGSRYTAPAREQDGMPVSSGKSVVIIRIIGSQFYVVET